MRLLSEITINSTLYRVSDYHHNLEHKWLPYIFNYTAPKYGTKQIYGGESLPKYGPRVLSPELFENEWPPSINCKSCQVHDMLIDDNGVEGDAVTIFEGNLHLGRWDKDGVSYNPYGPDNDVDTSVTILNDTLDDVFLWACDAARLNLTLDISAAARSTSTDVYYALTAGKSLRAELCNIARYFCHAFYEDGGTLYLVDLLADSDIIFINQAGFFSDIQYQCATPVKLIKDTDYDISGTHVYGREITLSPVCATGQTNREAALTNVLSILEYERFGVAMTPEIANMVKIGTKVMVVNDTHPSLVTAWLRVTDYIPSTAKHEIYVEGFGETSL